MLFSEPKIPQSQSWRKPKQSNASRFSALQRAENSSIGSEIGSVRFSIEFQCSSASRKFLNLSYPPLLLTTQSAFQCSSASRKFLNETDALLAALDEWFQCSSASRKFLNHRRRIRSRSTCGVSVLFSEPKIPQSTAPNRRLISGASFSALQRAENSSMSSLTFRRRRRC